LTICSFLILEVFVRRCLEHPNSGLRGSAPDWNLRRTGYKLLALLCVALTISLIYWLFPEYGKKLYRPFFELIQQYGLVFLLIAPLYVGVVDAYLIEPQDTYWRLGRILCARREKVSRGEVVNFVLGWAVKAFFLPLMFSFLVSHVTSIQAMSFHGTKGVQHVLFGIDVMIGAVGYLMTLRALGTHIRSAEPTLIGWIVALSCYPPFSGVVLGSYFGYTQLLSPESIFDDTPALAAIAAVISLFLLAIYTLATVSFGIRFSNLTNRGIISGGPYRYFRHPAYLSKNSFWWVEVLTHLPADGWQALRTILLMSGVSCIYWARAKTEERHLSAEPNYVTYSQWIEQNGFFARLSSKLHRSTTDSHHSSGRRNENAD